MRATKKNIHWLVLLLALVVLAVTFYVLYSVAELNVGAALKDAVISTLLLAVAIWGVILMVRAYPTKVAIILYALLIASAVSVVMVAIDYKALSWWLERNDTQYNNWIRHTLPVRFLVVWMLNCWISTGAALRKKIETLESKYKQQADASILLREAELFKLRQQLQPHFLYNSLNSISALVMIEPDKAQEMIGKLSDFLRSSVKREAEDFITLNDELEYIQSYLAIESIRFGDRLQVNFNKEYTDDSKLPPFLMQPILENAIKFGLYGKTGSVVINIHILLESGVLTITISNPFDPQMTAPRGTGFGLEGVKRRLYLLYARADLLETKSDEQYFTTILKIPQPYV